MNDYSYLEGSNLYTNSIRSVNTSDVSQITVADHAIISEINSYNSTSEENCYTCGHLFEEGEKPFTYGHVESYLTISGIVMRNYCEECWVIRHGKGSEFE